MWYRCSSWKKRRRSERGSNINIYKVLIQIDEVDEGTGYHRNLGLPYEAGTFDSEIGARKFAEHELMTIRPISMKLQKACQQVLDSLDVGGEQSRAFAEEIKILKDALSSEPIKSHECPKCGAGLEEREFQSREFLDAEAVHVHYLCKKCGSEIIEEFTLSDVFINKPQV